LNDSKQLSSDLREKWHAEAQLLSKTSYITFAVTSRTARQIDTKGIAACIRECIATNLKKLALDPDDCRVLLDGSLKAPAVYKNQETIIKGDSKEKIISLASVIAKVQRDHFMVALHKKHPQYDWNKNKGYGTAAHIRAIHHHGITPLHRQTFLQRILDK